MGPRPLPAQVDWHDGVRLPLPPRVETEDGLVRPARGSSCRHPTSLSRTGGGARVRRCVGLFTCTLREGSGHSGCQEAHVVATPGSMRWRNCIPERC